MSESDPVSESESDGLRFDELRIDYTGLPALLRYEARDGASLPYRLYPAQSDTHLILLHGSGYHGRYLLPLARGLSARGAAQVYTPDLRGHGVSPERRGDIDYIDQLEDDVADLVGHIVRQHSGARVVVGGHSSGGGLALRFAAGRHAGTTSALLMLSPFLRHDAPTTRPDAGGWARPRVGRIVALGLLNALGLRALNDAVVIEFDMPEAYRDGTETLAYSYRLNVGYAPRHFESELAGIDTPILVLVGSEDEAFLAEQFEPTVSAHAPQAEVRSLPGLSHMGIALRDESIAAIADWLARL